MHRTFGRPGVRRASFTAARRFQQLVRDDSKRETWATSSGKTFPTPAFESALLKRQALDALDAARRNSAPNGGGDGSKTDRKAPDESDIDAVVEVSDDLTSQSAVERVAPSR